MGNCKLVISAIFASFGLFLGGVPRARMRQGRTRARELGSRRSRGIRASGGLAGGFPPKLSYSHSWGSMAV